MADSIKFVNKHKHFGPLSTSPLHLKTTDNGITSSMCDINLNPVNGGNPCRLTWTPDNNRLYKIALVDDPCEQVTLDYFDGAEVRWNSDPLGGGTVSSADILFTSPPDLPDLREELELLMTFIKYNPTCFVILSYKTLFGKIKERNIAFTRPCLSYTYIVKI